MIASPRTSRYLLVFLTLLIGLSTSGMAWADGTGGPVYTGVFNDLAVGGYDPVAFFSDSKATKGSKNFEFKHRGATWRFASAENRDAFKADPTRFSPQYGGFCAWAMASGSKAAGKAPYWKIVDGKLYLNYSKSVQEKWLKDVPGFIEAADKQWPSIEE